MSLSCTIMAHPSRASMVDDLLSSLDRSVPVTWDRINDRHDTGIRAIEAFDPGCSHHLVLQDDAVVCRDLIAGVERALRYIPQDEPMCLYVGKVKPFAIEISRAVAKADGASWLTMQGIYWGVGIVLPTAHIPELAAWYRTDGRRIKNYDRRVSAWYGLRNARVWYPWPCLVDHRDTDSLVPGHGRGRFAHSFLDGSALDADWTGPIVKLPRTGMMDHARQIRARRDRVRGGRR